MRVLVFLPWVAASAAAAQAPSQSDARQAGEAIVRVVVRDTTGALVPFALVQPHNRTARTASDSGAADFKLTPTDTMRFIVRRLGFEAFDGKVTRDASGAFTVRLKPLVQSLQAARIVATTNENLERRGFYDRMERVQRGAYSARLIGPEELDMRNPVRISSMLGDMPFMKVRINRGRPMLTGRAFNCPMTVLLDGQRMLGMVEELFTDDGRDEIRQIMRDMRISEDAATQMFLKARTTVDDLVTASAVAAVEVYSSIAAAPAELQRNASPRACGIVALWTGSRR